jgi:hypothetical protein
MQSYLDKASALARTSLHDRSYVTTWNALEDSVLALHFTDQVKLYGLCADNFNEGAMIICAMLPPDFGSQDEINNTQ